ncbi:MFS transporter [Nocardia sp. CDC159]|uniref:MFS transporter n=1 Tax=Nocardia pulmonis TaxID=2951408 RepID=A0A9X2E411_9NOCA|nr:MULTISPECIES: MFS transporter [Nocardia]MCM6772425.1 MFS transporter [Nocardia pulmonis]MCM6784917.1 MFS transporter [Nocardia sp. CDC159]
MSASPADHEPGSPAAASPDRPPSLLRDNAFRRYWVGQTVSVCGDQISLFALPLVAIMVLRAESVQVGYLLAAVWLPSLFALYVGAWAERRRRRRRIMIAADLGRLLLLATIPLAYACDGLTLVQLYAVAVGMGVLAVVFDVCNAPVFTALVPAHRYIAGNSLLGASRAAAQVAGPGVGAVLVQALSAPLALLADALSYAVSAWALSRIAPREPPAVAGVRGGLVEGVRFIAGTPVMCRALAATATVNLFTIMVFTLFSFYAISTLGLSPAQLGFVASVGAVGGLAGAMLAGRVGDRIGVGPLLFLGCLLFPAPLLAIPAAHGTGSVVVAVLTAAEFAAAVGVAWLDIAASSLLAALTPEGVRGRVFGAYRTVNFGTRPVGALVAGALSAAIGVRPTLWVAAVGGVSGCVWLLSSSLWRIRTLPGGTSVETAGESAAIGDAGR